MTRFGQTPKTPSRSCGFSGGGGYCSRGTSCPACDTAIVFEGIRTKMKRCVKEGNEILDMIRPIHNPVIVAGNYRVSMDPVRRLKSGRAIPLCSRGDR